VARGARGPEIAEVGPSVNVTCLLRRYVHSNRFHGLADGGAELPVGRRSGIAYCHGLIERIALEDTQMSLNNAGDEIALLDAMNMERDQFAYAGTSEGVVVLTGH
jgi:hypothetical protein